MNNNFNDLDIENLTNLFNFVQINDETMPDTPLPNFQLLKLCVDTIPSYNGDPNTLEIFINSCTYLFNNYGNNRELNAYLLRVVISKLTDRALILIGNKPELNTWEAIRDSLRLSFGDQRNLECLEQDLMTLSPLKNEDPLEFGKRIQIARSRLSSKLTAMPEININATTKTVYLNQFITPYR